jgi:hypothetical protein
MTLTKWIANPQLVMEWRRTWEQAHMQVGMALLTDKALPVNEVVPVGVDIIHFHAISNARREGFMMALRMIRAMGRGVPDSIDPEESAGGWGEVDLTKPPQQSSEKQP